MFMKKATKIHPMILERNKSYKGDCIELIKLLPNESVDVICTDPPYLYLKNQKLDRPFDEWEYFKQVRRVLKPDGFIILFGRGSSFYRWNTILAEMPKKDCSVISWIKSFLGIKPLPKAFTFKEEIIWDKSYCSSPLMAMSRVHETVSIHTKGNGTINRVKVPYLEMKGHDILSICQDIKRMRSVFKNTKSLDAVLAFLENNDITYKEATYKHRASDGGDHGTIDRSVAVVKQIQDGMNEKSIVRTDYDESRIIGHGLFGERANGDRCANAMQSIALGLNEKSIIREGREHYKAIHPTQKPPRLLERLLALVCKVEPNKPKPLVLDTFRGSASTDIACMNFGVDCISFEIDDEYFEKGEERKAEHRKSFQPDLFKYAL